MTTAHYLKDLTRAKLDDLAESADLVSVESSRKQYSKKDALAAALDDHLRKNQLLFGNDARFKDYYRRLAKSAAGVGAGAGATPKRSARKKVPVQTDEEVTPSPPAARRKAPKTETDGEDEAASHDATSDEAETDASDAMRATSSASQPLQARVASNLPPSPRVVADLIEERAEAARDMFLQMWQRRVAEHVDSLRTGLSSVRAIAAIATAVEFASLLCVLVPWRYFFTTPSALRIVRVGDVHVKMPDVFVFLTGSFWAPLSLWFLTSLGLPLAFSYLFNLSRKAALQSRRRRGHRAGADDKFDPLIFNIVKGVTCYLVYCERFAFFGTFGASTVLRVCRSVPGEWGAMVTGAVIGVIAALYEAILVDTGL